ncbi:MAG: C39 family peptidase, partial [Acidobacteria bacterium]|nr:C39 family peptidase [Acidobacteriota bacterium]
MSFKKFLLSTLIAGICVFVGLNLVNAKAIAQEAEMMYEDDGIAAIQNLMPITETEGDSIHLTQIVHATYNPNGPSSSNNCGPTSLAMCLRALGYIGYGNTTQLNTEQQVDHARALLYPNDYRITTVTVYGIPYTLLNADSELTDVGTYGPGAIQRLGGESMTVNNQTSLDKALNNGMPIVLFGYLTTTWKNQFSPAGHWSGTGGHYIAVTGKTYDGYYIVNDPLYYYGGEPMTYAQVSTFLGSGISGTAFYWKTPTPCAITKSNGISNVFMRKISDNKIYRTYQTSANGNWNNWSAISTTTVRGNPLVIEQPNGRLLLFARGTNKNVYMFSEDAYGNMSTVTDFGGETYYELGVCKNGDGRVEFYARGVDGKIY